MVQSRHWFCTIKATDKNIDVIDVILEELCLKTTYLMVGFHIGEKTGYPHFHLVTDLEVQKIRHDTFAKYLNELFFVKGCDVATRKGSYDHCQVYLNKDLILVEEGIRIEGKSNDSPCEDIFRMIQSKVPLKTIIDKHPRCYLSRKRAIDELYVEYHMPPVIPNNSKDYYRFYFQGPSSTGKTTAARRICEDQGISYCVIDDCNSGFFQGYNGQHAIILEEFSYHSWLKGQKRGLLLNTFLNPHKDSIWVNIKNGKVAKNFNWVFITSNDDLDSFGDQAIINRFDFVETFTKVFPKKNKKLKFNLKDYVPV